MLICGRSGLETGRRNPPPPPKKKEGKKEGRMERKKEQAKEQTTEGHFWHDGNELIGNCSSFFPVVVISYTEYETRKKLKCDTMYCHDSLGFYTVIVTAV